MAALLAEADAFSRALYPEEARNAADAAFLARPFVRFFVARVDGAAMGCGGLVIYDGWGEIKRLIVRDAARGRGVGRALLATIEATARAERLGVVRLETGPRSVAALGLYGRAGYAIREPFAGYVANPWSVFMEKRLDG